MTSPAERWTATLATCGSFADAGTAARAWTAARLVNAPLTDLERELSTIRGRVASVGCGFGAVERYLALRNPEVEFVGYELEPSRVAAASAAPFPRVTVHQADVTQLDEIDSFDAAIAVDVFHHLDGPGQARLARALDKLVRPGGQVLVKDIATTPGWQHAFNSLHDRLAVGDQPLCLAPEQMAAALADAGLRVTGWRRLARFSPYPHYLVSARGSGASRQS